MHGIGGKSPGFFDQVGNGMPLPILGKDTQENRFEDEGTAGKPGILISLSSVTVCLYGHVQSKDIKLICREP